MVAEMYPDYARDILQLEYFQPEPSPGIVFSRYDGYEDSGVQVPVLNYQRIF